MPRLVRWRARATGPGTTLDVGELNTAPALDHPSAQGAWRDGTAGHRQEPIVRDTLALARVAEVFSTFCESYL
jgi:hypothetical protein